MHGTGRGHRFADGWMGWRRSLWVAVVVALAVVVSGPVAVRGQDEPTTQPVLVTFLTGDQPDGGSFNAVLTGPIDIAAAYDALAGDGDAGIPVGTILPGDFGINAPHAWHLAGVSFADLTAEGCSGTASYVDQTLNTWLRLGTFCPWSATVVAVAPYSGPIPSVDGGPGPEPSPGPCPGDSLPEVAGPSVVTFATDGGPFQVLLTDLAQVALASEALATGCDPGVPAGAIVEGDGGVNVPHGWHLEGVTFVATADPACDATPDAVDADLGTWVDQIGRFCPSSASVIDVQPYGEGGGPSPAPSPAPTLCDVVPDGSGPALATFHTGPEAGDTFRAVLTDPLSVALAGV